MIREKEANFEEELNDHGAPISRTGVDVDDDPTDDPTDDDGPPIPRPNPLMTAMILGQKRQRHAERHAERREQEAEWARNDEAIAQSNVDGWQRERSAGAQG